MRKKERYIAQGAIIGFGVTALIDILMQWLEHNDRGDKFTWESYDGNRTLRNGFLGSAIGAGIGYVSYEYQSTLEQKQSFNSDEYLKSILRQEDLKQNPELLDNAVLVRDKLKLWIVNNFSEKLVSVPENTGSFAKRTANAASFDIDILLPFRRDSFDTLEDMYSWTFEQLHQKFGRQAKVVKGTKAISISFEKNGQAINFDIVPGREIGNYKQDRRLNLYVKPNRFWKRGTSFKIDASTQRNMTINKPEARKVIRLLKIYNDTNYLNIPSVLLEQATVEALSERKYGVYTSNTDNLLNSMDYLAEKLGQEFFTDHGNTNNNLNNKIDSYSRSKAIELLQKDIVKIEANPYYLKEIFEDAYLD